MTSMAPIPTSLQHGLAASTHSPKLDCTSSDSSSSSSSSSSIARRSFSHPPPIPPPRPPRSFNSRLTLPTTAAAHSNSASATDSKFDTPSSPTPHSHFEPPSLSSPSLISRSGSSSSDRDSACCFPNSTSASASTFSSPSNATPRRHSSDSYFSSYSPSSSPDPSSSSSPSCRKSPPVSSLRHLTLSADSFRKDKGFRPGPGAEQVLVNTTSSSSSGNSSNSSSSSSSCRSPRNSVLPPDKMTYVIYVDGSEMEEVDMNRILMAKHFSLSKRLFGDQETVQLLMIDLIEFSTQDPRTIRNNLYLLSQLEAITLQRIAMVEMRKEEKSNEVEFDQIFDQLTKTVDRTMMPEKVMAVIEEVKKCLALKFRSHLSLSTFDSIDTAPLSMGINWMSLVKIYENSNQLSSNTDGSPASAGLRSELATAVRSRVGSRIGIGCDTDDEVDATSKEIWDVAGFTCQIAFLASFLLENAKKLSFVMRGLRNLSDRMRVEGMKYEATLGALQPVRGENISKRMKNRLKSLLLTKNKAKELKGEIEEAYIQIVQQRFAGYFGDVAKKCKDYLKGRVEGLDRSIFDFDQQLADKIATGDYYYDC